MFLNDTVRKKECEFKHDPAKKYTGPARFSQFGDARLSARKRSRSRDRGRTANHRDRRDKDRRDGNERRSGDDRQQRYDRKPGGGRRQ